MSDLSVTATQVLQGANATIEHGIAGATITAGQVVYKDTSDNGKFKLADANASATTATVYGIALNGAQADQPVAVQTGGTITIGAGAAPTQGVVYVVSATAGGIAPSADLTSGHYVSILGVGSGSNGIKLRLWNSGITV